MTDQKETRKTVLITGCSPGGIGFSLAREFHSKNYRVFATARTVSSIASLAAQGVETLPLELCDDSSITSLCARIRTLTDGRGLNILVNNAGVNHITPALDLDMDEVRNTFEANVFAVMRMCQVFAPMVIQAKGMIVMIGSLAGLTPYAFGASYNASKAALHAYSDTLRVELEPFGVRVITVITGGVQSNISRSDRVLRPDSLYLPVEVEFQRRLKYSQENAMPADEYAKSVVGRLTNGRPSKFIWEGNKSWLVWFVRTVFPRAFMDSVIYRVFNLHKLEAGKTEDPKQK